MFDLTSRQFIGSKPAGVIVCTNICFHEFTWLQVHEEHDVEPLPHGPEELDNTRGVESAPRAHLLAAEVTQRNLRSEDDDMLSNISNSD